MGCFNMRCAATGVPIICNTPVVMFDLVGAYPHHVQTTLGIDKFGDHFAVMSMPRFGIYNDYGDIENEEDRGWEWINSRVKLDARRMGYIPKFEEERYQTVARQEETFEQDHRMFILREAYDLMTSRDNSQAKSYDNDHPTVGEKRAYNREQFLKIVRQEDERSLELAKKGHKPSMIAAMATMMIDDVARYAFGLDQQDKGIWAQLIVEKPEVGDLYYKYISNMRVSTHLAEWSLAPSKYSGQTVDRDVLEMREIGTQYLKKYFKEAEEW